MIQFLWRIALFIDWFWNIVRPHQVYIAGDCIYSNLESVFLALQQVIPSAIERGLTAHQFCKWELFTNFSNFAFSSAKWSAGQVKVWNHWARMFFRNCALIWFYLETNSWCASSFKVDFKEACYWIWLTGNSGVFCILWWTSRLLCQTFFRHTNGEYFPKLAWTILTISYFIKINITYIILKWSSVVMPG